MALLTVMEFSDLAIAAEFGSRVQSPQWDSNHFIAGQELAPAAGNTQTSAFNAKTKFIAVSSDTACKIAIGTNPDGTTASTRLYLAAGVIAIFGVKAGEKLACAT